MRKILVVMICTLSLFLVACGTNGTSKKAIEEGKVAIVSKEYEKARDLFQLAVNEDSKNEEAKSLLELSNNYIELVNSVQSAQYDNVDTLMSSIEASDKLDIIKSNYEELKKSILENRNIMNKYSEEIAEIEKLMDENNIDEAKVLATKKLEEVKGYPILEDRLKLVINKVDEIIGNAKSEILKYHSSETDITYNGIMSFDDNSGVFAEVSELYGKSMYHFKEVSQSSPKEYVYDKLTNDVFLLIQGQVFWVSNGNIHLNAPEEVASSNNSQGNNVNVDGTAAEVYLTKEEAVEIATKKFKEDFPEETNFNAVSKDIYAGCFEVDMFDDGGRYFFGTYVVDAKSGSCWKDQ